MKATATEETKTRTPKANYDVVKGNILELIKEKPGMTLNQLNEKVGVGTTTGLKFNVIYAAIAGLKKAEAVFGTRAKKNEGLYTTSKEAIANAPVQVVRSPKRSEQPYILEKLINAETLKFKVIEGNTNKKAIMNAFKTANTVPGTHFRVIDNTGTERFTIAETTVEAIVEKPKTVSKAPATKATVEA